MKLSKKLSIIFIIIILITISLNTFISKQSIDKEFNIYLLKERDKQLELVSEKLKYSIINNNIDELKLKISDFSKEYNLDITVYDKKNNLLITNKSNNMNSHGHMRHKKMGMMRNSNIDYKEVEYIVDDISTITIGYYEDSSITENAIIFKNMLTKSFLLSSLISIIIGFFISIYISNSLTNPLVKLSNLTNDIKLGNYKKENIETNILEINNLKDSIFSMQDELKNQDNIRKEYASNISHELRTPITTLKTYIEASLDNVWELDVVNLNIMLDEANRLSNLVDDLNDSFINASSSLVLQKEETNISSLINHVIRSFTPIFDKDNIEVNLSIEDNIIANIDKIKIEQVIYNLISNSIKYMNKPYKKIDISLTLSDDNVVFSITDNGKGINKNNLDKIFDRFFREEYENIGSGLGLSIAYSNISLHNGSINVYSEVDKFTTFKVTIPKK